jgi:hypothetical protein
VLPSYLPWKTATLPHDFPASTLVLLCSCLLGRCSTSWVTLPALNDNLFKYAEHVLPSCYSQDKGLNMVHGQQEHIWSGQLQLHGKSLTPNSHTLAKLIFFYDPYVFVLEPLLFSKYHSHLPRRGQAFYLRSLQCYVLFSIMAPTKVCKDILLCEVVWVISYLSSTW